MPFVALSKHRCFFLAPQTIPGTQKVLTTFSLPVWLTMGLLQLLTTAVFWCVGRDPYRSVFRETHTYRSLSHCFYNTWAVHMGVCSTAAHHIKSQSFLSYVCVLLFRYQHCVPGSLCFLSCGPKLPHTYFHFVNRARFLNYILKKPTFFLVQQTRQQRKGHITCF